MVVEGLSQQQAPQPCLCQGGWVLGPKGVLREGSSRGEAVGCTSTHRVVLSFLGVGPLLTHQLLSPALWGWGPSLPIRLLSPRYPFLLPPGLRDP